MVTSDLPSPVAPHHMIGLARAPVDAHDGEDQTDSLREAGCARVFTEQASRPGHRPGLAAALDYARAGDTLVVVSLETLGWTAKTVLRVIDRLREHQVGLRILTGPLAGSYRQAGEGRFLFMMAAALLELDATTAPVRQGVGVPHQRTGGRPTVMTPERVRAAVRGRAEGMSHASIARVLGVGASSVARALARYDAERADSVD